MAELTQRGAERRLAQDMAFGRITKDQFLAGYRALTKKTVGAKAKTITTTELGYSGTDPAKLSPHIRTGLSSSARTGLGGNLLKRRQELMAKIKKNRSTIASLQR